MVTFNKLMANPARLGLFGAATEGGDEVWCVDNAAPVTEGTDDGIGGLENALATIFGFAPNVDITESPFGCDNAGRLTKPLIRIAGAAFPMGVRLRDDNIGVAAKEVRISLSGATLLSLDEQLAGSETAPTYSLRLRLNLVSGFWENVLATMIRLDTNVITLASGNNNDLAVTAAYLLVTPNSTGSTVTGFSALQGDGQWIVIDNIAGYKLGFAHEDTHSLAANRLALPGDVNIAQDSTVFRNHAFRYNGTTSRWNLVGINY